MSGYIILLNLPVYNLTIDGTAVETQGGFRGFHSVPPGEHHISITGYSGEELSINFNLISNEVDIRSYDYETKKFELANAETKNRYRTLAVSGAMGIALWPYPPSMKNITNPDLIQTIFDEVGRLKFLLGDRYEISLSDVNMISIGSNIIGIRTSEKTLFFEVADAQEVLMPPVYGVSPVNATFDPWLWQNLLAIINEYGD